MAKSGWKASDSGVPFWEMSVRMDLASTNYVITATAELTHDEMVAYTSCKRGGDTNSMLGRSLADMAGSYVWEALPELWEASEGICE